MGYSWPYSTEAIWLSGTVRPFGSGNLERPDSRQRRALLGGGPDQDVDQPNSAAHLRGGDAGQDCVHSLGQILGAHAQETGLVLVDLDPDRARRPDPVVVHIRGAGGGAEKTRHPGGDCAHLLRLASAYPVLEWPSDRRAKLERVDAPDDTREAGGERLFQPRLHALALLESLGDDHSLGEKVVRELRVQGQVEPDGALAHIGAPTIDVLIVLENLVQSGRDVLCCVDGRVLGQLKVDEQFGAVRRGKELLRNEAHSIERRAEQGERNDDRDPAGPHRQGKKPEEGAHDRGRAPPRAPSSAS